MVKAKPDLIPVERIAAQIYVIRGENVMLDSALARTLRRFDRAIE